LAGPRDADDRALELVAVSKDVLDVLSTVQHSHDLRYAVHDSVEDDMGVHCQ
jgi:hypothetical protein